MRTLTAAVLVVLAASACATPYQEKGFRGGVEASWLNERTASISASGNAYTRPQRVRDFVMLRASDMAVEKGFSHFLILSSADDSREMTMISQGSATTTTSGTINPIGPVTTYQGTSRTSYSPSSTQTLIKPGQLVTVGFLYEDEAQGRFDAIDASLIKQQLTPKYK